MCVKHPRLYLACSRCVRKYQKLVRPSAWFLWLLLGYWSLKILCSLLLGLQSSEDAKFYALSTRFKPFSNENETLVVQFSVKHKQGVDCGGGYVKLFPDTMNQEDMHSELEYYIMFGKRSDSSHCQLRGVLFFFFSCAWSYLWHNLCFETQVLLVVACVAFSSVQSLSRVWLFFTPWAAARQASLSHITDSWGSLKLMSIQSVMLSNHLILCCPLLLLPSIFPRIRVGFSHQVAQVLELQLQHQSFQWIFRVDFL